MKQIFSSILAVLILFSSVFLNSCKNTEAESQNATGSQSTKPEGATSAGDDVSGEAAFSKGLTYELNYDGDGYVVTGLGECTDKDILIPAEYGGKPVMAIGDNAFHPLISGKISYINSVSLPDTITEIGEAAFAYNPLTEITLPEGLRTINQGAFLGTMIERVSIPDSVKKVGSCAFMSMYLKGVHIGKGLSSARLGANAFLSAALEEISVSNKNPDLFVLNGALYSRDFTSSKPCLRLEIYPSASKSKSLVIAENYTLSSGCLAFAYSLEQIRIQTEDGTPIGPAFAAAYKMPLIDIAKVRDGSLKLAEISEKQCIHVNESIADIYLNMSKEAFLSEKRNLYVLPKADGMRYNGYTYHFTDGALNIEEYSDMIN